MEKKSTLLPFINDQKTESDDEQFPTFFTPLSIYVNREKQAREKYIKANTWKKCIKCNLRWQISLTEAKNGLHDCGFMLCIYMYILFFLSLFISIVQHIYMLF